MKGHNGNLGHRNVHNSSGSVKEAERRLNAILRTARKLAVTPDDLARLVAVRKLTQSGGGGRCRGCGRHVLPLLAALVTALMVLVVYSVEEQGFGCLKNTSEAVVPPKDKSTPAPPPGSVQGHSEQGHKDDPVTSPDRWMPAPGQLVRRER